MKSIELFAGGGGLALAAAQAGHKTGKGSRSVVVIEWQNACIVGCACEPLKTLVDRAWVRLL